MRYAVDSKRQAMKATGIVNKAMAWEEVDGKRRPSKTDQERNADTGMPLWEVEVMYRTVSFGRESTVTPTVRVGSVERPEPEDGKPIGFTFLVVEARPNKAGGLTEYWSAEEIEDVTDLDGASKPDPKSDPKFEDKGSAASGSSGKSAA